MAALPAFRQLFFFRSIIFKNTLLFLFIILVAVVPLALQYYQDSRDYEIQNLASRLEFFAERGASWIEVEPITRLTRPEHMQTPAYRDLVRTLTRIEHEFNVDNAIIMRREANGQYTYVATGDSISGAAQPGDDAVRNPCHPTSVRNPCSPAPASTVRNPCSPPATATSRGPRNPCAPAVSGVGIFDTGKPVHIHPDFPATYKATNDTWLAGEMMHSQLFGGKVGDQMYAQFLQINTPLKLHDQVVAILMLNKFADPVAAAVRTKTFKVVGLAVGLLVMGLVLFGFVSARMLHPLKQLTESSGEVAQGNLDIAIPPPRSRDEVGRLTMAFDTMLDGLRQQDFIRDTFGRYLSKEIVEELLSSPDGVKLGGELRQVTFLVSDLRGFTSMAAHLAPQQVIDILNRYLERMIDTIMRYGGMVDEVQGDGILAFFGVPLAVDNDPERAVACAIKMQLALEAINAEQRQRQLPELAMGIGINTGEVIVGNIGSEKKLKYGAVGSAINEAYRVESYTVQGQILISPSTHARIQHLVHVHNTLEVQFKGLDQPISIYDIAGLDGQYACALPETVPEVFTPFDAPLPLTCFVVEGKTVSDRAIAGTLISLGETTVEATLEVPVALHTNLKCVITVPQASEFSEMYAKVLKGERHREATPAVRVCLGLTSVPDATRAFLEQRCIAGPPGESVSLS
ncbi:hypothetical protein NKDENANG_01991 [Candidatus Entotheonellaceae bacterium PAL068K]